MNYELSGQVIKKFEIETFASGFQKQNIVVKTEDQYPQEIQIEFTQNKIDLIENINEGDHIKVHFNVNGRSWTNPQGEVKYFNSITGWRIEKAEESSPATKQQPATPAATPQPAAEIFAEEDDELPF